MKHLFKYIKRYLPLVLLAIVLLFVQANADLALPDYLSRIVNVGIQQGGISNAIPTAISKTTMDRLTLFMTSTDKAAVLADYTLVDKNSSSYAQDVKQVPALATEPVYLLNKLDQAQTNLLDPIMGRSLLTVSFIQLTIQDPTQAATMAQSLGLNLSDLFSGGSATGTAQPSPAVQQMLMGAIQAEYTALGVDLSKLPSTSQQPGAAVGPLLLAMRQSTMQRLSLFLSPADKAAVMADYTLVDKSSPNYAQYAAHFPVLAKEPVYVLKNLTAAQVSQLNPILAKGVLIVSFMQTAMANPTQAATSLHGFGFDLSKASGSMKGLGSISSTLVDQAAAPSIKAEYAALGMDTGKVQMNYLYNVGGLMLLVTLLSGACTITVSYLAARTAAGFGRDVRKGIFSKVTNFSNAEFDKFSTASLITRSTNDITQIQMVTFMIIRMVFYAPIIGIGGIIRALGKDTSMWWIIAVAVGILLTLILAVFGIALPKFQSIQKLIDRLNLVIRENLAGMMVIRAFNRQEFELNRFDKANTDLTSTMLFINRVMVVMFPIMMLIMNGVTVLIIWIGSHQVANANMQVGDMIAFMQYTLQIVFAFLMLSMMFIILPRASVSAGRIGEVLKTEPVIIDPPQPKKFSDRFVPTVEFRNVSFRYPDAEEDVLHNISFVAKPGQTTALIGSTGSGKSTVINLIPRFFDVTEGEILVDGVDIRQVTQHDLRDKIGYIPQKGTLFSGTIGDNLRFADENASQEAIQQAVDIAQAAEFITGNGKNENGNGHVNGHVDGHGNGHGNGPGNGAGNGYAPARTETADGNGKGGGFDAEVSQEGTNFSGGQKQRLSIARALVKKPPIYIFDDSFSAVDFKTDAALRRALKQSTTGSTILIVTQRVSTIKNAEQIIVLEDGSVIGKGTHDQLMRDCKAYREIALSQLSQEELL